MLYVGINYFTITRESGEKCWFWLYKIFWKSADRRDALMWTSKLDTNLLLSRFINRHESIKVNRHATCLDIKQCDIQKQHAYKQLIHIFSICLLRSFARERIHYTTLYVINYFSFYNPSPTDRTGLRPIGFLST